MSEDSSFIVGTPEYYLKDAEMSLSPDLEQTTLGNVSVTIEMTEPKLDRDNLRFSCEGEVEADLIVTEIEDGKEKNEDYGVITVDFIVLCEPNDVGEEKKKKWINNLEEQIDIWEEEGYEGVNDAFKVQLESEILSDVFTPFNQLIKNQFRGLVPRVLFRPPSEEET